MLIKYKMETSMVHCASMVLIVGETVLVLNISVLGVLKLRFFSDGAGFCAESLQFFYQVFLRL